MFRPLEFVASVRSVLSFNNTYFCGIGSIPIDWKNSSAFSNIFLGVQPCLLDMLFFNNLINKNDIYEKLKYVRTEPYQYTI